MQRYFSVGAALAVLCSVGGLALLPGRAASEKPESNVRVDRKLVQADNEFAFRLFSELAKQDRGKNVFISAPSVSLAISMAYNGAGGETQKAMAKALQIGEMNLQELNEANSAILANLSAPGSGVELSIANSLWAKQGVEFKPDFLQRNKDFYRAEVAVLDFADPGSVTKINEWVREKTKGKIGGIIDSIRPDDMFFVVNAVYFKGIWTDPFDKAATKPHDFTLPGGSRISVPMMSANGKYLYHQGPDFQAIRLPYGEGRMDMLIFLPSRETGIGKFLEKLNAGNWKTWTSAFTTGEGTIMLPRFKAQYSSSLGNALSALGMGTAFDRSQADFSAISSTKVWISGVVHKACVEVNEEGTEAAAVTGVAIGGAPPKPAEKFTMVVDRPFFCAIRDHETGLILFMGAIINPNQS